MNKKTHVIIGASAAGIGAITTLRRLAPDDEIICISAEPELPYNTCFLADYVAGLKPLEHLTIFSHDKAHSSAVQLLLGKRVTHILPDERAIVLDDDQRISYDTLFIGTGTSPIVPALPGMSGVQGLFTFHTLADMRGILSWIATKKPAHAVVIGAGLSGLECADALLSHGVHVSVVEKNERVLQTLITPDGASLIARAMQTRGVPLYNHETVIEIESSNGHVSGVRLASGVRLSAQLVICAVGLKPNIQLPESAGIVVRGQGIVVDHHMQTSIPGIYAAGDVVLVKDQLSGELVPSRTWPDAMFQGLVAAHAMAGTPKTYPGVAVVTSSAFFGLKFASCWRPELGEHIRGNEGDGSLSHSYLLDSGVLKGFCLVGALPNMTGLKRALQTGQTVTREQLVGGF